MTHILLFSGGKDSTALALLLLELGIDFIALFADTGWEHPLTYGYIWGAAETFLQGRLRIIRSAKYDGFMDLVVKRKMIPGKQSRFCTEELKVFPLWAFLETLDDAEITVYQGIRAEESQPRSLMPEREWTDAAGGYWIERPLFRWSAADVFAIHKKYGVEPNPLYKKGAGRVGCFPCIFVNHRELKVLLDLDPFLADRLRALERAATESGGDPHHPRTMFRSDYIPQRYCSLPTTVVDPIYETTFHPDGTQTETQVGERIRHLRLPTVDDVIRYIRATDEDQLPLLPPPKCLSIYSRCE